MCLVGLTAVPILYIRHREDQACITINTESLPRGLRR